MIKGVRVRSKIIFFIITMLSFVMLHDTVLSVIDHNEPISVVSKSETASCSTGTEAAYDLHSLFHFVALVGTLLPSIDADAEEQMISHVLLRQTLPCRQTIIKPPIA